jgi:hypothetical protein
METLIGIVLLLALCIWILVDAYRIRRKKHEVLHAAPGTPYTVAEVNQARWLVPGLACAFFVIAVIEWLHPSQPPFTGKGALLEGTLYFGFGPGGIALFWALFATGPGLLAFLKKTGARR